MTDPAPPHPRRARPLVLLLVVAALIAGPVWATELFPKRRYVDTRSGAVKEERLLKAGGWSAVLSSGVTDTPFSRLARASGAALDPPAWDLVSSHTPLDTSRQNTRGGWILSVFSLCHGCLTLAELDGPPSPEQARAVAAILEAMRTPDRWSPGPCGVEGDEVRVVSADGTVLWSAPFRRCP